MDDKLSLPQVNGYQIFKEQVQIAFRSGLLPKAIDTPEKALAIALTGKELGLKPMESLHGLYIVQGKVSLSAQLMLRLIYERVPGATINVLESDDKVCQVEMARPNHKPQYFSFTAEEAQRNGSFNKPIWKTHTATMLRWAAIRTGARIVFADAIAGCYMPDELEHEPKEQHQPKRVQKAVDPKAIPEKTTEPELPLSPEKKAVNDTVKKAVEILGATVEEVHFEKMPWEKEGSDIDRAMIPHGRLQGTLLKNWSIEECATQVLEWEKVLHEGKLTAKQVEELKENIETVQLYLEAKQADAEYERKVNSED